MAPTQVVSMNDLVHVIQDTDSFFLGRAQRQINIALTLRNWVIGYYIFEYEQQGKDRSEYGEKLYKLIALDLKNKGLKSLRERNLYVCRDFYLTYPQILRTPSAKSYLFDYHRFEILRTASAKSEDMKKSVDESSAIDQDTLISQLSFSHFIELLRAETRSKRSFYEIQTIRNNWSVRELKRAINSMLYERTGLSVDKNAVLEGFKVGQEMKPEDVFRNPYLLEFLGLEERTAYSETDLETKIITHLQAFLLEMGRGFCFEARQKRISFGNTHYRIDLVFYHRILKCHVLIDLKIGEFDHADAGQMNVYLNYYSENEKQKDDNPPVGIIMCAGKDDALVKYATTGMSQRVFVSKYLVNLPSEKELLTIIKREQEKENL